MNIKKPIYIFLALLLCTCSGNYDRENTSDTVENRIEAAESYLKNFDLESVIENIALEKIREWPVERRNEFQAFIRKEAKIEIVAKAIKDALVSNFTAFEIKALDDFSSSPEGLAIMSKFSEYADEVIPPIESEVQRVLSLSEYGESNLRWINKGLEFTAAVTDEVITAEFEFVNSGEYPVSIQSVYSSCGCLRSIFNKKVYQPGEQGKVTAVFNLGDRVGTFNEVVTVVTDEPDEPVVSLNLSVNIPEFLEIKPKFLFWSKGENMAPKSTALSILEGVNIQIVAVESTSELFDAEVVLDDLNGKHAIHVTPLEDTKPGNGKLIISAVIGSNSIRRYNVYLRILATESAGKVNTIGSSWKNVLWIDTGFQPEYDVSHIPGALILNEEEWHMRIENVLNQWVPGQRIVLYCRSGCRSFQVAQRLMKYGLSNVHIIVLSG